MRTISACLLLSCIVAGAAALVAQSNRKPIQTDAAHAATEDAIRAVIAESAKAYYSNDCKGAGTASWFPDEPPYVHFTADERVVTLATRDEIVAYCLKLTQNRVSAREEIHEQTVHLVSPDVAYVITRSTQFTQWRDGRTQVLPTIETAIVARQVGRWRVLYKHLSWGPPPAIK